MGIKKFLDLPKKKVPDSKKHILYTFFRGKRLAVDLSIIKTEAYSIAFGEVVKKTNLFVNEPDLDKVTEVFIRILMTRILSWLKNGFSLVMVLDGIPPASKNETREERKQEKTKKINEYNLLLNKYRSYDYGQQAPHLLTELRSKCAYTFIMGPEIHELATNICRTLGIPVLQAKYEAEWLCCSLYREGYVSGIISTDTDVYAHGCNCLLVTCDDEFHVNGEKVRSFSTVDINHLISGLGLNFVQFLDCCILAGCDYNRQVKKIGGRNKIGMLTGLTLIKNSGCIENIRGIENPQDLNLYECRKNFSPQPVSFNYDGQITLENININLNILSAPMVREDFAQCCIEAYIYQISDIYKKFPKIEQLQTFDQRISYVEDDHSNIMQGGVSGSSCMPMVGYTPLSVDQLYEQYREMGYINDNIPVQTPDFTFDFGGKAEPSFNFSDSGSTNSAPTFTNPAPTFTNPAPTFNFNFNNSPMTFNNNPLPSFNFSSTPSAAPSAAPITTSTTFTPTIPAISFGTTTFTSATTPSSEITVGNTHFLMPSLDIFSKKSIKDLPPDNSTPFGKISAAQKLEQIPGNPFPANATIESLFTQSKSPEVNPVEKLFTQTNPMENPFTQTNFTQTNPFENKPTEKVETFSMDYLYVNNMKDITDQDILNFGDLSISSEKFTPDKDEKVIPSITTHNTPVNFVV